MKTTTLPKRLDIDEVRELLGEAAADKLLAAYMRKKAGKVISVSTNDFDAAELLLSGQQLDTQSQRIGVYALGRISWKRCGESSMVKQGVLKYIGELRALIDDELPAPTKLIKHKGRKAK